MMGLLVVRVVQQVPEIRISMVVAGQQKYLMRVAGVVLLRVQGVTERQYRQTPLVLLLQRVEVMVVMVD
jgi:hypothetical protein